MKNGANKIKKSLLLFQISFLILLPIKQTQQSFCGGILLSNDPIQIPNSKNTNFNLKLPKNYNENQITFTFFLKSTLQHESILPLIKIQSISEDPEDEKNELNSLLNIKMVSEASKSFSNLLFDFPVSEEKRHQSVVDLDVNSNDLLFVEIAFDFKNNFFKIFLYNLETKGQKLISLNEENVIFDFSLLPIVNIGIFLHFFGLIY
jgi:hypothetical protein